jgi:hypothetical protein
MQWKVGQKDKQIMDLSSGKVWIYLCYQALK